MRKQELFQNGTFYANYMQAFSFENRWVKSGPHHSTWSASDEEPWLHVMQDTSKQISLWN